MAEGHGLCACGASVYCHNSSARGHRHGNRCRDCMNARKRASYDPRQQRSQSLRKRYGITADDFDAMLLAQGGCAACGAIETDGKYWHMDHDHKTGLLRGILCHGCNTGLGNFNDDPQRLRAAIDYLTRTAVTA